MCGWEENSFTKMKAILFGRILNLKTTNKNSQNLNDKWFFNKKFLNVFRFKSNKINVNLKNPKFKNKKN